MERILFICVANSARSQMAEGLGRQYAGHLFEVASAGSQPGDKVHPSAIAAMAEIGIDISHHYPKSLDEVGIENFDRIIALCAEESCPTLGKPIESWAMPDPAVADPDEQGLLRRFRKTRDAIKDRIMKLSDEIRLN